MNEKEPLHNKKNCPNYFLTWQFVLCYSVVAGIVVNLIVWLSICKKFLSGVLEAKQQSEKTWTENFVCRPSRLLTLKFIKFSPGNSSIVVTVKMLCPWNKDIETTSSFLLLNCTSITKHIVPSTYHCQLPVLPKLIFFVKFVHTFCLVLDRVCDTGPIMRLCNWWGTVTYFPLHSYLATDRNPHCIPRPHNFAKSLSQNLLKIHFDWNLNCQSQSQMIITNHTAYHHNNQENNHTDRVLPRKGWETFSKLTISDDHHQPTPTCLSPKSSRR